MTAARLSAHLSAARLEALRMQLKPHFLFNTLNSVSSLMYADVEKADAMITRLGDFLRLTIDGDMAPVTSVAREMEFARSYLEIEQIRFEERLTVIWNIGPETLPLKIPSFLLQPLIENAIHHGIAAREEGGTVRISSERRHDRLLLIVENDGSPSTSPERADGVGLRNTRLRIQESYVFAGKVRLTIADGSARVELELPTEELSDVA